MEVDEAASALSAIVNGMMPAPLVERELPPAVQEVTCDLPVRTTLDVDGLTDGLPVPGESTAYFVTAEALTNVIKHAEARRVELWLRLERDVVPARSWTTARRCADRQLRLSFRTITLSRAGRVKDPAANGTPVP